jgi:hypothetical protein
MKAYRNEDGTVRLFRPDKNMARMNRVSSFAHTREQILVRHKLTRYRVPLVLPYPYVSKSPFLDPDAFYAPEGRAQASSRTPNVDAGARGRDCGVAEA